MIKFILGILLIILVASVMRIDCLTCNYGPEVREGIKELFKNNTRPETMKGK